MEGKKKQFRFVYNEDKEFVFRFQPKGKCEFTNEFPDEKSFITCSTVAAIQYADMWQAKHGYVDNKMIAIRDIEQ